MVYLSILCLFLAGVFLMVTRDITIINGCEETSATWHRAAYEDRPWRILCHPEYSGVTLQELIDLPPEYIGIEIFNQTKDTTTMLKIWEEANDVRVKLGRHLLWGFAVDDTHKAADIGRWWITVYARSRSANDLLDAIEAGHFTFGNDRETHRQPGSSEPSYSGHWYKVNLHSHTTVSDGHLMKFNLVLLYWLKHYDALAITDHIEWEKPR